MKKNINLDIENRQNFPKGKRIFTVVRTRQESEKICAMPQEAIGLFDVYPSLAFFDNENVKKLNQYSSLKLPLFVHPHPG